MLSHNNAHLGLLKCVWRQCSTAQRERLDGLDVSIGGGSDVAWGVSVGNWVESSMRSIVPDAYAYE